MRKATSSRGKASALTLLELAKELEELADGRNLSADGVLLVEEAAERLEKLSAYVDTISDIFGSIPYVWFKGDK